MNASTNAIHANREESRTIAMHQVEVDTLIEEKQVGLEMDGWMATARINSASGNVRWPLLMNRSLYDHTSNLADYWAAWRSSKFGK